MAVSFTFFYQSPINLNLFKTHYIKIYANSNLIKHLNYEN